MKHSILVLVWLLLCGCASLGPASDADVLTKRDFTVLADLSQVPDSHPRTLSNVRVERDSLKMTARFVGGCQQHDFILYVSRKNPEQVSAFVRHIPIKETCRTWVEQPLAFSLNYLKKDLKLASVSTLSSYFGEPEPFSVRLP